MFAPGAGFRCSRNFRWILAATFVCSAGLGGGALAMWMKMSDDELLQRSDLIVIGTWLGREPAAAGASAPNVAAVAVSEVLKGPATTTRALVVMPAAEAPRSSTDIHRRAGDRGLWLLRKHPGGVAALYLADHPQRFVPMTTEAGRIDVLRKLLLPAPPPAPSPR